MLSYMLLAASSQSCQYVYTVKFSDRLEKPLLVLSIKYFVKMSNAFNNVKNHHTKYYNHLQARLGEGEGSSFISVVAM